MTTTVRLLRRGAIQPSRQIGRPRLSAARRQDDHRQAQGDRARRERHHGAGAGSRFLVFLPLCIVWVIALIAQHTVSSLVLAVVLVMLGSISAFTTSVVIRARRARGANWFTGLAPKVRSN
jgi:Flp pilus assembly protein TadB